MDKIDLSSETLAVYFPIYKAKRDAIQNQAQNSLNSISEKITNEKPMNFTKSAIQSVDSVMSLN
jgi:hypothetical protein